MCCGRSTPPLLPDQAFDVRHEGGGCREQRFARPEHSHESTGGGRRPPCLGESPVPQARVQGHTVERIIETFVPVPILDVPVPQSSMDGVQDQILQRTAELVLEAVVLVIEMPKISFQDRVRRRASLPVPQRVRAVGGSANSCLFLSSRMLTFQNSVLRLVEQIIVPGEVFLPGQRSLAFRGAEHFSQHSVLPGQGSTGFGGAEHHDDVGFLPGQSSTAFRGARAGVVADTSSSTLSAHGGTTLVDDDDGVEGFFEDHDLQEHLGGRSG